MDLDIAGLAVLADALVVIEDGHRQRLLRAILSDDVAIQLVVDFAGPRVFRALGRFFLRDDVIAQRHALVADEDTRTRDELAHLASPLPAKRAVKIIHRVSVLHPGPGPAKRDREMFPLEVGGHLLAGS
jgi:hypothetical protein